MSCEDKLLKAVIVDLLDRVLGLERELREREGGILLGSEEDKKVTEFRNREKGTSYAL
jgi:hypothetical protein